MSHMNCQTRGTQNLFKVRLITHGIKKLVITSSLTPEVERMGSHAGRAVEKGFWVGVGGLFSFWPVFSKFPPNLQLPHVYLFLIKKAL